MSQDELRESLQRFRAGRLGMGDMEKLIERHTEIKIHKALNNMPGLVNADGTYADLYAYDVNRYIAELTRNTKEFSNE